MGKGKKTSGVSKTSNGQRRCSVGAGRSVRNSLDHMMNALRSWKKGSPPSKKIQECFRVPAMTPYVKWKERGTRTRQGEANE